MGLREQGRKILVTEANEWRFFLCFQTTCLCQAELKQWWSPLIEIGASSPLFLLLLAAYKRSLSLLCRWLVVQFYYRYKLKFCSVDDTELWNSA